MAGRILFSAALLCGALTAAAADGTDAAKPYTRFLGVDLFVGQNGELRPVRDVNGSSWVVIANGQPELVSAKNGPISMKMTSTVKLTENSASITNLQATGAYTPGNDPTSRMARSLNQAGELAGGAQAVANQSSALGLGAISGITGNSTSSTSSGSTSTNSSQPANMSGNDIGGDITFFRGSTGNESGFDALDVGFDVASERTLNEPYIVMITRFHDKAADPGTFKNLVYAKALNPIVQNPTSVHFEQTGFPAGFELKNFEIHLYDQGEEIATNHSPQRESLSAEQAFDYVKAAYLKAHKGETLGAAPILAGRLPGDLQERLSKGMYSAPIYVRVSKEGLAEEPYADAACSKPIGDPYLESVVRSIYFKPALSNGTPVEGVTALNLSQLRT